MKRFISFLILMFMGTFVYSQKNTAPFGCVTLGENKNILPMGRMQSKSVNYPKEIKLVFHVCYTDAIPSSNIPPEVIYGAVDQLNVDYMGTNISFVYEAHDYINLREFAWHDGFVSGQVCFPTYKTQSAMISKKYSWDRAEYCNVYIIPKMCSTILGFAYVTYGPANTDDGVWVKTETFGYGAWPHLNPRWVENETFTHELGHYCGLFHTFHNTSFCGQQDSNVGCEYEGDYVCDTAPTKASRGCPGVPGIFCPETTYDGNVMFRANNHMDYCPEECRDVFTPGQIDRMHRMLEFQRYELFSDETATPFCLGDFDKNGMIGTGDLLTILSNFGCVECGYDRGDMNMDSKINVYDLNFLLAFWGDVCGDGIGQIQSKRSGPTPEVEDPWEIINNYDFPERGTPTKEKDREEKKEEPSFGLMTLVKEIKKTAQFKLEEIDELDLNTLFSEYGVDSLIVNINEDEKIVIER